MMLCGCIKSPTILPISGKPKRPTMTRITTAAFQALRPLSLPPPPPPPLSLLSRHHGRPRLHLHLHLRPRRSAASVRRTYHSSEHDAPPPFPPAENAILCAAIPHIPTHGFTTAALSRGARDVGYLDASINLFPAGAFALVNYHLITHRLALADHHSITTKQQAGGGVAKQVKALAWERLQANKPIIHRWQEVRLSSFFPYSPAEVPLFSTITPRGIFYLPTRQAQPSTKPRLPDPLSEFFFFKRTPAQHSFPPTNYPPGSRPHRPPNQPPHLPPRTRPPRGRNPLPCWRHRRRHVMVHPPRSSERHLRQQRAVHDGRSIGRVQ